MLLLLPLDQKPHKHHLPWVTALLVLINVFVYAAFQTNDDAEYMAAAGYYIKSGLMDIERPIFEKYLKQQKTKQARNTLKFVRKFNKHDEDQAVYFWQLAQFDQGFQKILPIEIRKLDDEQQELWQTEHPIYENRLSQVTTLQYGFIPERHNLVNWFTHQFMHGSWGHLFGNMLFLILVGYAVEMYLGALRYAIYYILGGLGAVGLFWALDPSSKVPLVGASGAIAGVMGMYAGLYRLRKIRFFYWFIAFFNYMKAPALIMLPLWMAKEVFGMVFSEDNVAYSAHLGGLIAGGALGLLSHHSVFKVKSSYLETVEEENAHDKLAKQATAAMTALDFDEAERCYRELVAKQPHHLDYLVSLFNTLKRKPVSDEFHRLTQKIFENPTNDRSTTKIKRQVFLVYKEKTQNKFKLPLSTLVTLASGFAVGGAYKEAESLLTVLSKRPEVKARLANPLLLLARSLIDNHQQDKAKLLLEKIVQHYPKSPEAEEARNRLTTL